MNIKLAIENAVKGDFKESFKSLSTQGLSDSLLQVGQIVPSTYRSSDVVNFFQGGDGIERLFRYNGHDSAIYAYENCPPVSSIINRKAQSYINGKTWILNRQGKESTSPEAKKLRALFAKPNPIQSQKQFEAQGYIYQQLFGYNLVLTVRPYGFSDPIDTQTMWNIPPSMVDIEETKKLFYNSQGTKDVISKVVLNYKGVRTPVDIDNLIMLKDIKPSFDSLFIPESRLSSLEFPINNIIGSYESRNVLINYRGALGILSHDPGSSQYASPIMDPADKEQLQKDFQRYGLRGSQWQFIVTNASLKWQQMGTSVKDLMLFEEVEHDIQAICDEYNYPYQLISAAKGATFSNLKEGKQLLYQDATIPEAESMYEQWNTYFKTADHNITIEKDYSHIQTLQKDELDKAKARFERNQAYKIEYEMGLITRNQWRVANGDDPVSGDDLTLIEVQQQTNEPLSATIGVMGVQSLVEILIDPTLDPKTKENILVVVFGILPADAKKLVDDNTAATLAATQPPQNTQNETTNA